MADFIKIKSNNTTINWVMDWSETGSKWSQKFKKHEEIFDRLIRDTFEKDEIFKE